MMRISKEFKLDYAHLLMLNYSSACQRLHGHSATITLEFDGVLDGHGMIRDYTSLPKAILMEMDHKFVVPSQFIEKNHPDEWLIRYGGREFTLPPGDIYQLPNSPNSTAECIARHLYDRLINAGYSDLVSVTFSETAATKAVCP
jgi:6-pyruvoyl-tetrahydropterin synthase